VKATYKPLNEELYLHLLSNSGYPYHEHVGIERGHH